MHPARKVFLVFQGFVKNLTLVNTHATQLNLFFIVILLCDYSSLVVIFGRH